MDEWDGKDRREKPEWVDEIFHEIHDIKQNSKSIEGIGKRDKFYGIFEIVTRIVLAGTIAMMVWVVQTIHDHDKQLAVIQANRFTIEDGLKMHEEMSNVKNSIPKEVPPKWLLEKIQGMNEEIKDIKDFQNGNRRFYQKQ